MRIDSCEIYSLHIPFLLNFAHSRATRLASDSFVVKLTASGHSGYGEAVVRDYVSGSLGEGDVLDHVQDVVRNLVGSIPDGGSNDIIAWLRELPVDHHELPVLCAVETALLDLLCATEGKDIYELIGMEPCRTTVQYGGTIPMFHVKAVAGLLEQSIQLRIPNLRLKIGDDGEYNRAVLALARKKMGDGFDIRVDVNMAWSLETVFDHLEILKEAGVNVVEEPFGRKPEEIKRCVDDPRSEGFDFVADESILTMEDLDLIAKERTFTMLNLRLSKNGGLLRCLNLAAAADTHGISYQLGCLVGETGILSAAGRVAASLMKNPRYTDGSYDSYLLSDNIVQDDLTFGPGGAAEVIRGRGIGFSVDEDRLKGLSNGYRACI